MKCIATSRITDSNRDSSLLVATSPVLSDVGGLREKQC